MSVPRAVRSTVRLAALILVAAIVTVSEIRRSRPWIL